MAEEKQEVKQPVSVVRFASLALKKEKDNGYPALLTWSSRAGFPRISVFLDKITDENNKVIFDNIITAPFDYVTLQMFFNIFEEVINSEKEIKRSIDCLNTRFENGVRTNDIIVQAKIVLWKTKEGVINIMVVDGNKAKVKFELLPNLWYKFYDNNNEIISDVAILSKLHATAYLKTIKTLFGSLILTEMSTAKFINNDKDLTDKLKEIKAASVKPVEIPAEKPKVVEEPKVEPKPEQKPTTKEVVVEVVTEEEEDEPVTLALLEDDDDDFLTSGSDGGEDDDGDESFSFDDL